MDSSKSFSYMDLGLVSYSHALELQRRLRKERQKGLVGDTILLCEHPAVFTVGKQDCDEDWLSLPAQIESLGFEVIRVDRGGKITYHGPGQLVVYFIVDIKKYSSGVKEFVTKIEGACLNLVSSFGLDATKNEKYPGIWIDDKKIAAIGLHISRGISMHGAAINVHPDMSHYQHIIPCGIKDKKVTSMKIELNEKHPTMEEVKGRLSTIWG
jgi:lipoyl(octanoyl) transferase